MFSWNFLARTKTGSFRAVVVRCEDRILDMVSEKAAGLLRLRFLVGTVWAARMSDMSESPSGFESESEDSPVFEASSEEEEARSNSSSRATPAEESASELESELESLLGSAGAVRRFLDCGGAIVELRFLVEVEVEGRWRWRWVS